MGRRLYRFGHVMFGLATLLGLVLWLGYRVIADFPTMVGAGTGWLHAKLALVVLLLAHFIVAGRWLKGLDKGRALPSSKALRWFHELPELLQVAVVYQVLAKPFCTARLLGAVVVAGEAEGSVGVCPHPLAAGPANKDT